MIREIAYGYGVLYFKGNNKSYLIIYAVKINITTTILDESYKHP